MATETAPEPASPPSPAPTGAPAATTPPPPLSLPQRPQAPALDGPPPSPRTRHRPPPQAFVLFMLLLAGATWWAVETWRASQPPGPLTASGTVEADEVVLAAEVGGRLTALPVAEGRAVRAGDVVARLDDTLVQLQLAQADSATRRLLEVQAERHTVRAPTAGVVVRLPVHVGEVVGPVQPLATVADLSTLRLTIYVLQRDLGRVAVGQAVSVTADPFPGHAFQGSVTGINDRAEFTPRNVQTQRDRQNLVFGVRVRVENPGGALKPGLPVDVAFGPLP